MSKEEAAVAKLRDAAAAFGRTAFDLEIKGLKTEAEISVAEDRYRAVSRKLESVRERLQLLQAVL